VAETAQQAVEAVVERVSGEAEREAEEPTDLPSRPGASTSQPDQPGPPSATSEQSSSVGQVIGEAAGTTAAAAGAVASEVRRFVARVYDALTGDAESKPAGASFEPTEATARSGRPRRFKDVQAGMQLEGKVTSIALYGVFVDVGVGRDGLVHISEMSESRIDSPTELVQIGDPVTVWVKSVDPDARRISLTMRDPNRPKPPRRPRRPEIDREKLAELKVGDTIEGTISSLAPFGAFVDIGVGKDGLVHISELAEGRVDRPEDAVQVGERYNFKVLEVDPDGRRISLSLRRAQRSQRLQQLEPGTQMDGTVSGLAPFGAFVDVGVGRDGLVHISELSSDRVNSVEDIVKVGDKVQVKVIEVDPNSKRISLTMRVDEPLPQERPRPAGRVGGVTSGGYEDSGYVPTPAPAPEFDTGRSGASRGEGRSDYRGSERAGGRTGGRGEGRGEGRGGRGGGRGESRGGEYGRSNRLGGRNEGRSRREGQIYEPSEEVYTFEDPEEETFTGDATLEDLVSKFNAGKNDKRDRRRDDDEEEDGDSSRGRRDAIRRTLAMRDEE
jgi:predicted RNA-binding protein with RPS1 domain